MPRRLANLVLLGAIATLLATGVVAWLLPDPAAAPLYLVHRVAGLALVLALVWKYAIARRSLGRRGLRGRAVWIGLTTAALTVIAAGLGVAWSTGVVSFDQPVAYSALNLHVIAGIGLALSVVMHALLRGEDRPALVALAGRRAALRGIGLLVASFAASTLIDVLGPPKRPTGSRHAGSFSGNDFPTTIWSFDAVPPIDAAAWRLRVSGAVSIPAALSYDQVMTLPRRDRVAILDCTGGWWTEQTWSGVSLREVLMRQGLRDDATKIEVISVTGHRWTFDRVEAEQAILATHVGGEPLAPAHGYPLRLVAPGLRGFLWIKWVGELVAG